MPAEKTARQEWFLCVGSVGVCRPGSLPGLKGQWGCRHGSVSQGNQLLALLAPTRWTWVNIITGLKKRRGKASKILIPHVNRMSAEWQRGDVYILFRGQLAKGLWEPFLLPGALAAKRGGDGDWVCLGFVCVW